MTQPARLHESFQPYQNEVMAEAANTQTADLADVIQLKQPAANQQVHHLHGSVEVAGAKVPVPYTVAVPEHVQHQTLGIIVPGFGAIKRTSRGFRESMAGDQGIITASYDPVRLHRDHKDWRYYTANPQKLHYDTVEAIIEDIKAHPRWRDTPHADAIADSKVTLMPHSMGGLPAAEWALDHHDQIDSVVYMGSIGLEDPSLLRILNRTKNEVLYDIGPGIVTGRFGYSPRLAKRSAEYFVRNPLRTLAEINSCGKADIRPHVKALAKLGVSQAVICLENDRFFHPVDTIASVGHIVNHYEIVSGSEHTAPQTEAKRLAAIAGRIISQLA